MLDASRAVGVVNKLSNPKLAKSFDEETRADYERLRAEHSARLEQRDLVTIARARENRTAIDWSRYQPPKPEFQGLRVFSTTNSSQHAAGANRLPASASQTISLKSLIPFIDWSPFFHAWELRGRYPAILDDAAIGEQARELFDDAQELLAKIVDQELLHARGVIGFWPANAIGDDVELFTDESRSCRLTTLHFLRQQMRKPQGQFNHCLADYVASQQDYMLSRI